MTAYPVDLDLDGRLLRFAAPPSREDAPVAPMLVPDWGPLFTAAGLEMARFKEIVPPYGPQSEANARVVWSGSYPGRPDLPVRVEAVASAAGVTSFEVLFPWTAREPFFPQRTDYLSALLLIIVWIAPFFGARHNYLRGRADLRGALRIGTLAFFAQLGFLLLLADSAMNALVTRPVFWLSLALGSWVAIVYIALEPWVRRWWPHALLGWARLLAGRWRDPLVARDVLVGLAVILAYRCIYLAAVLFGIHRGAPPVTVAEFDSHWAEFVLSHLSSAQFTAAGILSSLSVGLPIAAGSFFFLAAFRTLLRNPWLYTAAFCLLSYGWSSFAPGFRGDWISVATYPVFLGLWLFGAIRYGFLVVVIGTCGYRIVAQSILTTEFGAWYGRSSLIAVLLVSALAIWAFRVSLGNRPLLSARGVKA